MTTLGLIAAALTFCQAIMLACLKYIRNETQIIKRIVYSIVIMAAIMLGLIGWTTINTLKIDNSNVHNWSADGQFRSGFDARYFSNKWKIINGHDSDFGKFKARYIYTGNLDGGVKGTTLTLDGDVVTVDRGTNVIKGTAHFSFIGPVNNNQSAGYFTYKNDGVDGFGSAFIEFDSAGSATMHLIFRITKPRDGEGDIGAGDLYLSRVSQN